MNTKDQAGKDMAYVSQRKKKKKNDQPQEAKMRMTINVKEMPALV